MIAVLISEGLSHCRCGYIVEAGYSSIRDGVMNPECAGSWTHDLLGSFQLGNSTIQTVSEYSYLTLDNSCDTACLAI